MQNTEKYSYILSVIKSGLNSSLNILEKSKALASEKGISDEVFLDFKLAPDMFDFRRQIQILSDTTKGNLSQLSGAESPSMPDTEVTFDDLISRIKKTQDYVNTFTSESFKNAATVKITSKWIPGKYAESDNYIENFTLANFHFHLHMAYAIARANGVQLGKGDITGGLNFKDLS